LAARAPSWPASDEFWARHCDAYESNLRREKVATANAFSAIGTKAAGLSVLCRRFVTWMQIMRRGFHPRRCFAHDCFDGHYDRLIQFRQRPRVLAGRRYERIAAGAVQFCRSLHEPLDLALLLHGGTATNGRLARRRTPPTYCLLPSWFGGYRERQTILPASIGFHWTRTRPRRWKRQ